MVPGRQPVEVERRSDAARCWRQETRLSVKPCCRRRTRARRHCRLPRRYPDSRRRDPSCSRGRTHAGPDRTDNPDLGVEARIHPVGLGAAVLILALLRQEIVKREAAKLRALRMDDPCEAGGCSGNAGTELDGGQTAAGVGIGARIPRLTALATADSSHPGACLPSGRSTGSSRSSGAGLPRTVAQSVEVGSEVTRREQARHDEQKRERRAFTAGLSLVEVPWEL